MRDYDCEAVLGYVVDDLVRFFGGAVQHQDEKSHMEDRYDTRTGQVVGQEKVVDRQACDYVVLDGQEFEVRDDCYVSAELGEALGALLDADVHGAGHFGEEMVMIIQPNVEEKEGVYDLDDVPFMVAKAKRIGDRCRELGFNPGQAGLRAVLSSC